MSIPISVGQVLRPLLVPIVTGLLVGLSIGIVATHRKGPEKEENKAVSNDVTLAEMCKRLDERINHQNILYAERTQEIQGLRDRITALEKPPLIVPQRFDPPPYPWWHYVTPLPGGGWGFTNILNGDAIYITNAFEVGSITVTNVIIDRQNLGTPVRPTAEEQKIIEETLK